MNDQSGKSVVAQFQRSLVVDGTDTCGNFAGDGEYAPFVVFDVDRQENIAGPFGTRQDGEKARSEILAGASPMLDSEALLAYLSHERKRPEVTVRDAAQALLKAFGGDTPSWLREEAVALENALAREAGANEGDLLQPTVDVDVADLIGPIQRKLGLTGTMVSAGASIDLDNGHRLHRFNEVDESGSLIDPDRLHIVIDGAGGYRAIVDPESSAQRGHVGHLAELVEEKVLESTDLTAEQWRGLGKDELVRRIEAAGYSVSGPTDSRAAENGEPVWVCNAREALSEIGKLQSKYVVMGKHGHTLGYLINEKPGWTGILAFSALKGGYDPKNGPVTIVPGRTELRAATRRDFEVFGVEVPSDFVDPGELPQATSGTRKLSAGDLGISLPELPGNVAGGQPGLCSHGRTQHHRRLSGASGRVRAR